MNEREQAVTDYIKSNEPEFEEGPVTYLSEDIAYAYPWLFSSLDEVIPVVHRLCEDGVIELTGDAYSVTWSVVKR